MKGLNSTKMIHKRCQVSTPGIFRKTLLPRKSPIWTQLGKTDT